MAHYRKLTINGITYEYNVGKTFIQIRNKVLGYNKLVPKAKVGVEHGKDIFIVTPKMIACFVQGIKGTMEDFFSHCTHDAPKRLCADPFDAEIREKVHYRYICDECYDNSADDI